MEMEIPITSRTLNTLIEISDGISFISDTQVLNKRP